MWRFGVPHAVKLIRLHSGIIQIQHSADAIGFELDNFWIANWVSWTMGVAQIRHSCDTHERRMSNGIRNARINEYKIWKRVYYFLIALVISIWPLRRHFGFLALSASLSLSLFLFLAFLISQSYRCLPTDFVRQVKWSKNGKSPPNVRFVVDSSRHTNDIIDLDSFRLQFDLLLLSHKWANEKMPPARRLRLQEQADGTAFTGKFEL